MLVYGVPVAASLGFVRLATETTGVPTGSLGIFLLWWFAMSLTATVVVGAGYGLTRRLLPLGALLELSLVFPDEAPSRFRVALRTGTVESLEERLRRMRNARDAPSARDAAEILLHLVGALDVHDRLTRGHAERVRAYSYSLGRELGLATDDLDRLNWAALLHDIGKLEVSSEILNKPGRPTADEWEQIRAHPLNGEALVEPLREWLGTWADAVGYHHERWDGEGYPRGVAGAEIPLAGRIVAIADVFDVITSARSYKESSSLAEARTEITRCSGTQFDPQPRPGVREHVARQDAARDRSTLVAYPRAPPRSAAAHPVTRRLARRRHGAGNRSDERPRRTARCSERSPVARCRAGTCVDRRPRRRSRLDPEGHPPALGRRTGSVPAGSKSHKTGARLARLAADCSTSIGNPNDRHPGARRPRSGGTKPVRSSSPAAPEQPPAAAPHHRGDTRRRHSRRRLRRPPSSTRLRRHRSSLQRHRSRRLQRRLPPKPANQPPTFAAGSNQSVLEDAASQSVAGWATAISSGAGETSQSVSFTTVTDGPGLFAVQPTVAPDGTLAYTPAPNVNGTASISVTAHDDGGTAAGGSDTSTPHAFTISIAPVNDAPIFSAGPNQAVVSVLGAQAIPCWATGISPGAADESAQSVTFVVDNDSPWLFAVQPAVAANGTLSYKPKLLALGTATVTIRAVDNGGTASGGSDSSAVRTFTINIL